MSIRPLFNHLVITSLVWVSLFALGPTISSAETVQIPVGQQGGDKQNLQRPRTGMSQEQVKKQFGNPINWSNPVGNPPITTWTYADFVVYFEYDHVIHSVVKHTAQVSTESSGEALQILSESEQ